MAWPGMLATQITRNVCGVAPIVHIQHTHMTHMNIEYTADMRITIAPHTPLEVEKSKSLSKIDTKGAHGTCVRRTVAHSDVHRTELQLQLHHMHLCCYVVTASLAMGE